MAVIAAGTAEPAATNRALVFGPHPRMRYVLDEALGPAPGSDAAGKQIVAEAEKILANPIEIPSEEGQWIFYYACPEHNATLQFKDGKHTCPQCGKVFDDERTRKAYVTLLYDRVDRQALTLAQAWQISKRDVFATQAVAILDHYARTYPEFGRHDRWGRRGILALIGGRRFCQSLDEAVSIIKLAQAYDLIYESRAFTPEVRARIEKDLFEATVETIYAPYMLADGRNNHMTWFNAGVATVGAALGRPEMLEKAVNGPKGLRYQLDASVTAEGLWYEGTIAYHFYALQAVVETVRAAGACGMDLTAIPNLKKMFLAPLTLAYPNGQLPALNDGDQARITGYRDFYQFAIRTWKDPVLERFAMQGDLSHLGTALYPDAGLAYLRRGTGKTALTAILDFGQHGGHHGHPDKLNLLLYALGQEIFLDPGRLTYSCPEYETWTRQTVAHNTVVVNQDSQKPEAGTSLAFGHTSQWDVVVGEADRTYPGTLTRRALVATDRFVVDFFRVQSVDDRMMDWVVHGAATLSVSTNLAPRKEQLYNRAGYQHLADLQTTVLTGPCYADWKVADGRFLRTRIFPSKDATLVTGNGIGYDLSAKVPFVMLRTTGRQADFVAVHDASGDGSLRVERLPSREPGHMQVRVADSNGVWQVEWDSIKRPADVRVTRENP